MVAELKKQRSFRAIAHRRNQKPIADRLTSVTDRTALAEIEAITNPRAQQDFAARKKIRPEDLVGSDGNEMVLASFTYSGPSRFTDGTYGVYYAATEFKTAIAESAYHTERFLSYTNTQPTLVYKRILTANITGAYNDLREIDPADPIYSPDPNQYASAQAYALRIYANNEDGIIYNSVRAHPGTCIAAFRPKLIAKCKTAGFIAYTYDGKRIDDMFRIGQLEEFEKPRITRQ